jgi:uncharacterized OB-fold protein
VTELEIQRCTACGTVVFPDRLRCPACGGVFQERVPAGPGRVAEETLLRGSHGLEGPVRLGSVHLEAGPVVIARLDDEVGSAAEVRLELATNRTIWARRPQH